MGLKVKEITKGNLGKCVYISNDVIEMYVSVDNGFKIIYFGFKDSCNLLYKADIVEKGSNSKEILGDCGHSFSVEIENNKKINFNKGKVVYFVTANGVRFVPESEYNEIEVFIEILIGENAENIMIVHGVKNLTSLVINAAIRSITNLEKGGTLIIPQNIGGKEDMPNRAVSFWPYSKINDERFFIGNKYITFRHDKNNMEPFRFGVNNRWGFALYSNKNNVFFKRYVHNKDAKYLNFGSSLESFSNNEFLSLETLSPIYKIGKNEVAKHVESWSIFKVSSKIFGNDKLCIRNKKVDSLIDYEKMEYENKIDEFINKV